jgi:hypothetical protein
MSVYPTFEELARRGQVMVRVLEEIRAGRAIRLPDFDPAFSRPSDQFALQSVGLEPNDFGGAVGAYRYQFEGEEDLLHLIVTRLDGESITVAEGQAVAAFLLPDVPPALIWLRPGELSQHFYVGHDELLRGCSTSD